MSTSRVQINNECVRSSQRDAITGLERAVQVMFVFIYIGLLVISMKNVVMAYKLRRKKTYQFLPKINLLFFTAIYLRFAYLLDSIPVIWGGMYLYDTNVLKLLETTSYISILFICVYASVIWMELQCFIVLTNTRHLTIRQTIKALSTVIVIMIIIFMIMEIIQISIKWRIQFCVSLTFCCICVSGFSGVLFLKNMHKVIMQKNISLGRKLIVVSQLSCFFRLIWSYVYTLGSIRHLRIRSCYQNSYVWPLIITGFEVFCQILPIVSFMIFFKPSMNSTAAKI